MRESAIRIQSWWKGSNERRRYVIVRRGVVRVQAIVRGRRARRLARDRREQMKRRLEAQQAAAKYDIKTF